ncbi:MAG: hypothetical protein ACU0BB_10905 [Paracoccaceae bacterium]
MADTEKAFDELDGLFSQARAQRPVVPDALKKNILSDARTVQDEMSGVSQDTARSGLFEQIKAALGGWPSLGGLVAASLVGVWIGVAPPDFLTENESLLTEATQDLDLFDSFALESMLLEEG